MKLAEVHYFTDRDCESPIWLDIPLDDDREVTPDIAWIFTHGQCHALGAALHEILGWSHCSKTKVSRQGTRFCSTEYAVEYHHHLTPNGGSSWQRQENKQSKNSKNTQKKLC